LDLSPEQLNRKDTPLAGLGKETNFYQEPPTGFRPESPFGILFKSFQVSTGPEWQTDELPGLVLEPGTWCQYF
jgi:hypothetical protein